jgi:hypothetical protein
MVCRRQPLSTPTMSPTWRTTLVALVVAGSTVVAGRTSNVTRAVHGTSQRPLSASFYDSRCRFRAYADYSY